MAHRGQMSPPTMAPGSHVERVLELLLEGRTQRAVGSKQVGIATPKSAVGCRKCWRGLEQHSDERVRI